MKYRGKYNGEEIEVEFEQGFNSERSPIVGGADILSSKGEVELVNLTFLGKDVRAYAIEQEHARRSKDEPEYKTSEIGQFIESFFASVYELADEVDFNEPVERDWDE